MSNQARHIHVDGRVQGVHYRESAREEAERLGITGWVRNLGDGRVEIKCEGEPEAVEQFLAWLRHGPAQANVNQVLVQDHALLGLGNFTVWR
nr:acylphosphatase [Pseudomonas luteola]